MRQLRTAFADAVATLRRSAAEADPLPLRVRETAGRFPRIDWIEEWNDMAANVLYPTLWESAAHGLRALNASSDTARESGESDARLMHRYRQGDADAFETLYRRHRDRLHRYILRVLGNAAETEEVFQEVWMAVIRGSGRYTERAKFATYLFSIAHRRALDRLRPSRHRSGEPVDEETFAEPADSGPAENAVRMQTGHALLDAIAALPLLQREAFLLHAEGDLNLDEIAAITQVNREAAKSRLRYANARLRKALEAWR